jgi:hypothetical protein
MQIQTSNQIPNQINNIVISKKIYNVIRSIVDSSTKPSYEWNKPIVLEKCKVKFVKYKVLPNNIEVKAWEITIQPLAIQREGAELMANLVTVFDGLGNKVAELIIRNMFTTSEQNISYILRLGNERIEFSSVHEFEYYLVSPSEPVPYARPVSLASFINKLMFYYYKAMGVVRNADAAEAKQV